MKTSEQAYARLFYTAPSRLGRAASRLGEDPGSVLALLIFGVDNVTKAATVLDDLVAVDS
jgi:hypothetical protein